jgi:drug/metabolite transporter (DMT)-like permease
MNSALFGLVAAVTWGIHDFLARYPARAVGAVPTELAVTVVGLVILSAWILVTGVDLHIAWPKLWLVAASGICIVLGALSLFSALALGPISVVAPIASSYPAIAVIFALALGSYPSLLQWLAITAVMAGVTIVARSGGRNEGPHREKGAAARVTPVEFWRQAELAHALCLADGKKPDEIIRRTAPTGESSSVPHWQNYWSQAEAKIEVLKAKRVLGLAFGASLGFALSLTSGQVAAPIFGDVETVWLARIFGLAAIGAIQLSRGKPRVPARWLPLLGLMGTLDVVAVAAIITAGNLADPEFATVVSSVFGAVTVLLARLFLKESIAPLQLAGMALIFGGVAVLAGL